MLTGLCERNMRSRRVIKQKTVGESLLQVLWDAHHSHRLTYGVFETGNKLRLSTDSVMLCILPDNQIDDPAQNIHSILIKAFCLENGIFVVKVDSDTKRDKLIEFLRLDKLIDLNCILVEYPQEKLTNCEQQILDFCRDSYHDTTQPFIELEV